MLYPDLQYIIKNKSEQVDFNTAVEEIQTIIFQLSKPDFLPIVVQIGSIPENIQHDSTEEKLYTKVSDIILAKCFIELNMKAKVLHERANSADVFAESKFHNYSLVADAKAFRLSRTAKKQKDFKVESMVHWKHDNDFSVLCCPYFQYPKKSSQIYGQALNGNISLFSWEYFYVLLKNEVKENPSRNLEDIWNQSAIIAKNTSISDKNVCFLERQDKAICSNYHIPDKDFKNSFAMFKRGIIDRGNSEIDYWQDKINEIKLYTKDRAIQELISALKLNEKIKAIDKYIKYLEKI